MKVASDGRVPVGRLLGEEPSRSRWRTVLRWRDWSLPVKLGSVTLIPILIALVLGGVTLVDRIAHADRADRQDRLAEAGVAVRSLLDALQRERTLTAEALTAGDGIDSAELRAVRGEVDDARPALAAAADRAAGAGADLAAPRAAVAEPLDALSDLRERISSGQVDAVEAVSAYSDATGALLDLHSVVMSGITDDALTVTADGLHHLLVAREAVSVHRALVGHGLALGLTPSDYEVLRTAEVRRTDRIAEFEATVSGPQRERFTQTVRDGRFDTYVRTVDSVLSGEDTDGEAAGTPTAREWSDVAGAVSGSLGRFVDGLGAELAAGARNSADDAAVGVGVLAVLLVVAFLLAAVVVFVITRNLLRSLRVLRRSALDVAEHDLPDAVREIQEGRSDGTGPDPVGVHTRDEIGQVARAFDAVHEEALRLASEQANMRAGYAGMFVNLSRRSQSLVQRQLQLIERLEADEEDADQLATLFQLDHLATRMRRNNENLMVLSGAEPGRRSGQPVSTTDVLRAAVSEIEQYQRVVVRTPPAVDVVGYAAGDLIRLVAELLDNATAFSAPETRVTVASRMLDDGRLSVEVLDEGIGMNEAEIAEANGRIGEAGSVDLTTSRRMGLFVVGRLAARHGFDVVLHGGRDITGVRASVTVSAEAVTDAGAAGRPEPEPAPPRTPAAGSAATPGDAGPQAPDPSRGTAADAYGEPGKPGVGTDPAAGEGAPLPRRKPGGQRQTVAGPSPASHASPAGGWQAAPEPTDSELSGTALFTPIDSDGAGPGRSSAPAPVRPTPYPGRRPVGPASGSGDVTGVETTDVTGAVPEWPSEEDAPEPSAPAPGADVVSPGGESPAEPAGDLSGRELFRANNATVSEWWNAAVSGGAETAPSEASEAQRRARQAAFDNAETTPIFDEMVSAWFRKVTDAAGTGRPERTWDFATDESFRTVEEVSRRADPPEFTDAGLPRRRRGERLLPGSAAPADGRDTHTEGSTEEAAGTGATAGTTETAHGTDGEQAPDAGARFGRHQAAEEGPRKSPRNPAEVLGRLSSFQQGVSRGRRHRRTEPDAPDPPDASGGGDGAPVSPRPDVPGAGGPAGGNGRHSVDRASGPDPAETTEIVPGGAGGGARGARPHTGSLFADPTGDRPGTDRRVDGASPLDERWRTAREVTEAQPTSYTSAGLPRRSRGEQLVPGSAVPDESEGDLPRLARDPADVRGRLNNFQQGVRRGRHAGTATTDLPDERVEGE